jgi:hypothetical protein
VVPESSPEPPYSLHASVPLGFGDMVVFMARLDISIPCDVRFRHVQQQRDSRPLHSGVANHNGLRSMHPLFSKHKRLLFLLRLKRPRTLSNYYVRTVNRKHLARKFINAVRDILAAPSHRDRQLGIAPRYEHLIALRYPEPPKQQWMRRS